MLLVAGLSHHQTPLALRERCAVASIDRPAAYAELRPLLGAVVLLSTCERIELYVEHADPLAAEAVMRDWLGRRAGVAPDALAPYIERAEGEAAVRRLIRVACGLESAVQGEDDILGQVRRARHDAATAVALSPALDGAFRLAVQTGRQARRLGGQPGWTSLADAAAARIALAVGHLAQPRVFVAGTGPMGLHAARALRDRLGPALALTLASRTPGRSESHAPALAARPTDLADLAGELAEADAAVVALRVREPVLDVDAFAARPAERPLVLVDLSVPRAVAAPVADLPAVRLDDVDQLLGRDGGLARWQGDDLAAVTGLVERAVAAYGQDEASVAAVTLAALHSRAEQIRRGQLERTLRRLGQADAATADALDALTRAIVRRVLYDVTGRLRADGADTLAPSVRDLFGLDPPARS